jgi:hypothetical protein
MERSKGELRIRTDFNVTNNDLVTVVKQKSAFLIDLAEELVVDHDSNGDAINCDSEKRRLISLAQTAYEEAAMWLVKAITI